MLTARPRLAAYALAAFAFIGAPALAQDNEVNVYTTREPGLIQPLFDAFTKETGITVNAIFVESGLAERVEAEGENSPADVSMVVDYGNLIDLVDRGLTQPVQSGGARRGDPGKPARPGGQWFALSMRARVIYVSKDRVDDDGDDLRGPRRPEVEGPRLHPLRPAPLQHLAVRRDDRQGRAEETEEYLTGLKDNLARTAGGGDRDVARDILADICDVGVGNSYYVGLMRSGAGGPEQQEWGEAIKVILPTFADGAGTHVNISGAAVAEACAEPRQRREAARIPGLAGGAGDLRQAPTSNIRCSPAPRSIRSSPSSATLKIDPLPLTEIGAAPQSRRASSSTRSASTRRCEPQGRCGPRWRSSRRSVWWAGRAVASGPFA